jgi:hypothetical protein
MLRRLLIAFIALFYLAAASGVAVNLHYCMGKIASVSLMQEKDHDDGDCSKCGMNKTVHHCCKDDVFVLKLNETHQPSLIKWVLNSISQEHPQQFVDLTASLQGFSFDVPVSSDSPPPFASNKRYRAMRVFRI